MLPKDLPNYTKFATIFDKREDVIAVNSSRWLRFISNSWHGSTLSIDPARKLMWISCWFRNCGLNLGQFVNPLLCSRHSLVLVLCLFHPRWKELSWWISWTWSNNQTAISQLRGAKVPMSHNFAAKNQVCNRWQQNSTSSGVWHTACTS